MDTTLLHTQILSWIQGAPTTIDGELRCIAATCVSEVLSEQWGVNLGSWDAHIHENFDLHAVLKSLYIRVDVELQLLSELYDVDEWSFLYRELMAADVDSVPVIAPGGRVSILHRDFTGIEWMAEDWANQFGRIPLGHALAVSIIGLRNALSGASVELPRIYGPLVSRNPSSVIRQANHWFMAGRRAEARAHLREYTRFAKP